MRLGKNRENMVSEENENVGVVERSSRAGKQRIMSACAKRCVFVVSRVLLLDRSSRDDRGSINGDCAIAIHCTHFSKRRCYEYNRNVRRTRRKPAVETPITVHQRVSR